MSTTEDRLIRKIFWERLIKPLPVAVDEQDYRYELARHLPSGEIYILKCNSLWEGDECTGWTYTQCAGPLKRGEWLDSAGAARPDWRQEVVQYLAEIPVQQLAIDANWANTQDWYSLASLP